MVSTSSSDQSWSPPRPRRRVLPLLTALAVVVVLAAGGALAVFLTSGDDAEAASVSGPRRTAAELARKGLNCTVTTPVTVGVAPAKERVTCATGAGSDAVVSTFADAKTARADADTAFGKLSDDAQKARGLVVGPYWTVNCSLRAVCESAASFLDGKLLS